MLTPTPATLAVQLGKVFLLGELVSGDSVTSCSKNLKHAFQTRASNVC